MSLQSGSWTENPRKASTLPISPVVKATFVSLVCRNQSSALSQAVPPPSSVELPQTKDRFKSTAEERLIFRGDEAKSPPVIASTFAPLSPDPSFGSSITQPSIVLAPAFPGLVAVTVVPFVNSILTVVSSIPEAVDEA